MIKASLELGRTYDPFKSDVYSLGLLMLYAARLKFPTRINFNSPSFRVCPHTTREATLANLLREEIGKIKYPEQVKDLLCDMLQVEPSARVSMKTVNDRARILLRESAHKDCQQMKDACDHYEDGKRAKALLCYDESVNSLREAWRLVTAANAIDPLTVSIGLDLVEAQFHESNPEFKKQKEVLKHCQAVQAELDSSVYSETAIRIENALAAVSFYSTEYSETQRICLGVLKKFTVETEIRAEHWMQTVYHLTWAYRYQNKQSELIQMLREWEGKDLRGTNEKSEFLKSVTVAHLRYHEGMPQEAETLLIKARRIAAVLFPTSLEAARNLGRTGWLLGNMNEWRKNEAMRHDAELLFSVHFPGIISRFHNFIGLGCVYREMGQYSEAIEACGAAKEFFMIHFRSHINAARNLSNLAWLYIQKGNWSAARANCLASNAIFHRHCPYHEEALLNLYSLAYACQQQGRKHEEFAARRRASAVFKKLMSEDIAAGHNFKSLSVMYKEKGKIRHAIYYARKAIKILARYEAVQDTIDTLRYLVSAVSLDNREGSH